MRRFLLISGFFPPEQGGIQTYLAGLFGALPEGSVQVLAPSDREKFVPLKAPLGDLSMSDAAFSQSVTRVPLFSTRPPFHVRTLRQQFENICQQQRPDAIVLGHFMPSFLLAARSLRMRPRIPVIQILHGYDALAQAASLLHKQVAKHLLQKPELLITTTRTMRDKISATFDVPTDRFAMIPPGVAPTASSSLEKTHAFRSRLRIPEDARIVLCVARLTPRKGQDTLIRALPTLRAAEPSTHLLLAGPDGGSEASLRQLAAAHGVQDAITFTGSLSAEDLTAAYASATVFCLPNRDEPGGDTEGFGIVLLEAMSAGLPVIGGNAGGVPEAISDGQTGLLTDGTHPDAVAKTILRVLHDADLAARLAANGRTAAAHASWTNRAQAFLTTVEKHLFA